MGQASLGEEGRGVLPSNSAVALLFVLDHWKQHQG